MNGNEILLLLIAGTFLAAALAGGVGALVMRVQRDRARTAQAAAEIERDAALRKLREPAPVTSSAHPEPLTVATQLADRATLEEIRAAAQSGRRHLRAVPRG